MTDRRRRVPWGLEAAPPPERWDDWAEQDALAWPARRTRKFRLIPTICFNCESACGLLAYTDAASGEVVRFEGNPVHPGSRGRVCAKGPATLNQIRDPERILRPLRRVGPRGRAEFREADWEEALEEIGGRIRRALDEGRHDEVMYHVGRPGDDHFMPRLLAAWGVDGHNSHTNVCSASARAGYALSFGADRPSPDYASARFILLLSAHLETGHYFNPHAQRIMDAKERGARLAVVDTRLSNSASLADMWISPWPGTESALILSVVRELLRSGRYDADFLRKWVNWEDFLKAKSPESPRTFERFLEALADEYDSLTPGFVAEECRIPVDTVGRLADEIAAAGPAFSSHLWRNAAAGNLGGWQVARALMLLHALTGSIGVPGGVNPNTWDKATPQPREAPPPGSRWNELLWPAEYPLSHYEMSFLLPHLLREQDRRLEVYFTRVYNPVWTNPDGCSWVEMLEDEERVRCHVALTPTWNETCHWADWVLPMGLGPERHDLMSQETHAGAWIGFRQPVGREFRRRTGEAPERTLGSNPGEVWEEAEFWIALTWKVDPDGSRGIRRYYESKLRPGTPVGLDEYYAEIFEHAVPGLPQAAEREALTPLEFMRRYGAFALPYEGQRRHEVPVPESEPGVEVGGIRRRGFPTPSRKIEVYSPTLESWGWGEDAAPRFVPGHVHWRDLDFDTGERLLLPTFRLPTLIHTRSGNAKWLQEISHTNPLWVHPADGDALGIGDGALARVETEIGYFVLRAWHTQGIHPGVVACSHHLGRWRLAKDAGGARLCSALVDLERPARGRFLFRRREGITPFPGPDPDTARIWWREGGVNQNLTFPVQPDPVSGMHCWHQKVRVRPAGDADRYGDIFVDTNRAREVFRRWLAMTKPAPGPGGLRRPLWLKRPLRPEDGAYHMPPG